MAPLLAQLIYAGPASDPIIAELVATIERERRTGNGHMVAAMVAKHGLPDGLTAEQVIDTIWTLTSPENADRLLRRCGWSPERYEDWLATCLQATLA